MITIPKDAETIELPSSTIWFDEDGIMWSKSKKSKPQSFEQAKQTIEFLTRLLGGKKVCMLLDITESSGSSREVRDLAAAELPKITKAMAIMSDSALGKMIANIFFTIKSQPYPTKMFNDEKEAVEWLRQYL